MSPIGGWQSTGRTKIPPLLLSLFLSTSSTPHLALTPSLSRFLSPLEAALTWLRWVGPAFGNQLYNVVQHKPCRNTECLCVDPVSPWGGQPRPAAPDKSYCLCNRLQDHWSRNTGCEAWLWMAKQMFSSYHITGFVLFMVLKFCFLVRCNYASSLLLLWPHPLIEQNNSCSHRVFCYEGWSCDTVASSDLFSAQEKSLLQIMTILRGNTKRKQQQIVGHGLSWVT